MLSLLQTPLCTVHLNFTSFICKFHLYRLIVEVETLVSFRTQSPPSLSALNAQKNNRAIHLTEKIDLLKTSFSFEYHEHIARNCMFWKKIIELRIYPAPDMCTELETRGNEMA